MIQENSEQTSTELIAHSGLHAPMRPRPHPRNVELFGELTDRRFNASAHPDLEFPERLGIEMWHYIQNKKNKLWIWKALDRNTGHLIDWKCGDRDKETLEKLTTRLATLDVKVYYTDRWRVYETLLPASKHVQTKAETHCIERNNCLMRHWFGRFKRKSIVVSNYCCQFCVSPNRISRLQSGEYVIFYGTDQTC